MGMEELGRKLAALKDIRRSVEIAMEKKKEEEAAAAGSGPSAGVSDCFLLIPAPDQATEAPPPSTTLGPAGGV
ncbi:agamous-like MADS-box protein AGL62 [Iris pallida]|uniref:Agamous-like MADS-box protein AGL62 n=1 Tax=Iris pallida TaxID=29817 RepID=A0AAX6IKT0_IRIPA|nr:agamous-like MADS-box protein AGL62 [Iris pallida]